MLSVKEEIREESQLITAADDFHPILSAQPLERNSGNRVEPAVRVRVQPRAIHYLNLVASNLLAQQLPRLLIPNIEHHLPSDQGIIKLSRIRISRFKRAELHDISTSTPDRITWLIKNMNIGLIGSLSGNVNILVPFDLTGEAEVLAEGLSFELESAVHRENNGSARVTSLTCHTTIRSVNVVNHNGGLFGLAITVFKQGISDNVRTLLQGLICKKIRKYIDEDLNWKLAEVQTKSSLSEAISTNSIRGLSTSPSSLPEALSLEKFFGPTFSKDFMIDYTLAEDPVCGENEVELSSVGEISVGGRGGTPFPAPPLSWPKALNDDSMLLVMVSDFVPNSLLYHAYKQRLIKLHLNKETPGVAPFLRTNCGDSMCIADVIPQLSDKYPKANIELVFAATRAPAMLFSQKNQGVISINIGGVIILYVEIGIQRHQEAVFDLEVVADTTLNVKQSNVSGSVRLTRFDLLNRYGKLEITNAELADIALLGGQLIENMVNEMLNSGVPIPIPSVLHLDEVNVQVLSRKLLVRTNFGVDERKLSKIAEKTIFSTFPFNRSLHLKKRKRF
ncbi:unnamed protein product, partial [Mesorhabditis belari]|uniref:Lipid-binding serum glycoprotein C-terminal domain-containing protein n=1 Tax=Mesorhabditis belari TaxID=2138241 RepID=A0AAF3FCM7_9BILA